MSATDCHNDVSGDSGDLDGRNISLPAGRLPYLPALDGLRAIALIAVLAVHGGFEFLEGGYLPLSSFFVLSGFLITALLLLEHQRNGRIDLRAFWRRRARRLVPGLLLGLGAVAVYVRFGAPRDIPHVEGDFIATLGWVTNWRFIATGQTYEDIFADPSPLQHFWSLAVEEQFYLFLPLLVVGTLTWKGKRLLVGVVAAMAIASTLLMNLLYDPGDEPFRAYLGTDARAAELLIGVLLACAMIGPTGLRRLSGRPRAILDVSATVALVGLVASWIVVTAFDPFLFEGGMQLLALVAALVITAGVHEGTVVARLLSLRPLVALGVISYGVYLFHWPVFLWLRPERLELGEGPLFAVRCAVTLALAVVSYRLIEKPVRFGAIPGRPALVGWANASVLVLALLVVSVHTTETGADEVAYLSTRDADTAEPGPATVDEAVAGIPPLSEPTSTTTTTTPSTTSTTAASSTPDRAPPSTVSPTTTTTTRPDNRVRVLVFGDSLGDNYAYGLDQLAQRNGEMVVESKTILGCMVTRGGDRRVAPGANWPIPDSCEDFAATWPAAIEAFRPDVVLVSTGANEVWDRKIPGWSAFKGPGDVDFDSWMLHEYSSALQIATASGAAVVWAGPPCVQYRDYNGFLDDSDGNRRIDLLSTSILPRLSTQGHVTLADVHGLVCPGGIYSDTVLGVPNARPDGVHFNAAGTVGIAERYLGPLILRSAGR